jgi:hypothetical protein
MSLSRCLARDARYRHLRVVDHQFSLGEETAGSVCAEVPAASKRDAQVAVGRPSPAHLEPRLRATVLALRDAFLSLFAALLLTGCCVYAVGVHEGARMEVGAEYVPVYELLKDRPGDTRETLVLVMRAGFAEYAERPKFVEVRL